MVCRAEGQRFVQEYLSDEAELRRVLVEVEQAEAELSCREGAEGAPATQAQSEQAEAELLRREGSEHLPRSDDLGDPGTPAPSGSSQWDRHLELLKDLEAVLNTRSSSTWHHRRGPRWV